MAKPLDVWQQCRHQNWLVGEQSAIWADLTDRRLQQLTPHSNSGTPPTIFLTEADPIKFLAGFMAACVAECPVFLGNPYWTEQEWQEAWAIAQPDLIWGESRMPLGVGESKPQGFSQNPPNPFSELLNRATSHPLTPIFIPTGGSSGKIRFAIHTWDTLMASVQGFRDFFRAETVNACCVLPLYHVSGLMQFLRSLVSGGKLAIAPFKGLAPQNLPLLAPEDSFISLVPTQLQRLLQNPQLAAWLSRFHTVMLGGAPAWEELLLQARANHIRVALTYGMTETASQIVTLQPDDFLGGNGSCGQVLPHAHLTICDDAGQPLKTGQVGHLRLQAKSLALGYWANLSENNRHQTVHSGDVRYHPFNGCFCPDDLGYLDDGGYLHLVGRSSDKIITGGENVFPTEVEAAIRATGLVEDVCVLGVEDASLKKKAEHHWGEVVTAVYVARPSFSSQAIALPQQLQEALMGKISRFKQPKCWIAAEQLPRNAQGKLNRAALQAWVQTQL